MSTFSLNANCCLSDAADLSDDARTKARPSGSTTTVRAPRCASSSAEKSPTAPLPTTVTAVALTRRIHLGAATGHCAFACGTLFVLGLVPALPRGLACVRVQQQQQR